MTTRITIKNEGPERALVSYYDEKRNFQKRKEILKVGESIEVNVWNGCVPVIQAVGNMEEVSENGAAFFSVPPAHY